MNSFQKYTSSKQQVNVTFLLHCVVIYIYTIHVWIYSLQAAFIFLYLCLAAWAALGDEFGQMLTLGLHTHSLIVATIIHPLGHVTAAGWIVSLAKEDL